MTIRRINLWRQHLSIFGEIRNFLGERLLKSFINLVHQKSVGDAQEDPVMVVFIVSLIELEETTINLSVNFIWGLKSLNNLLNNKTFTKGMEFPYLEF